jgi:thiamine phosphate synthase YjbQ (UPF0047 family)
MRTRIIQVHTGGREAIRDITTDCAEFAKTASAGGDGLLHVFVPHATAGVALIELGAGSDGDLLATLAGLLPVALVDLNVDNPDRQVRLSFLG